MGSTSTHANDDDDQASDDETAAAAATEHSAAAATEHSAICESDVLHAVESGIVSVSSERGFLHVMHAKSRNVLSQKDDDQAPHEERAAAAGTEHSQETAGLQSDVATEWQRMERRERNKRR